MAGLVQRLRFFADHRWSPRHMSEYLDGGLGASGRERIERHLRDCHRCRELLRTLRGTVFALARLGGEPGGVGEETVAASVLAGVRQGLAKDEGDGRDV